jgi:hypothetical protein
MKRMKRKKKPNNTSHLTAYDNDVRLARIITTESDRLCWSKEILQRFGLGAFDRSFALCAEETGQAFLEGATRFGREIKNEHNPINRFYAVEFQNLSNLAWFFALARWYAQGFPTVLLRSHTHAAALAATSIPEDIEFHAPFASTLFLFPDGLLSNVWGAMLHAPELDDGLWTVVIYRSDGFLKKMLVRVPLDHHLRGDLGTPKVDVRLAQNGWAYGELNSALLRQQQVVSRIVFGACLALTSTRSDTPSRLAEERRSNRAKGVLPACRVFHVGAPVNVDCRKAIEDYIQNGSNSRGPLTLQFLVRGHWRNQACGPRWSERRLKWIEPHWKGPTDGLIKVRPHVIVND